MEDNQLNPVKSPRVTSRAEAWLAWRAANIVKQQKIKPSAWSKHFQAILRSNEKLLELFVYGVRPNRGEVQVQLRKDQSKVWINITKGNWCQPRDWLVREDHPYYVHRQEIINDLINSKKYRGGSYVDILLHSEPHMFEEDASKLWDILADAELRAFLDGEPDRYIYVREFLKALPEDQVPAKPTGFVAPEDILRRPPELKLDHALIDKQDFFAHCKEVLISMDNEKIPDVEENLWSAATAAANERLDNAFKINNVKLDTMAVHRMLGGSEYSLGELIKRTLSKDKLVLEEHPTKHFIPILSGASLVYEERLAAKLIEAYETFTGERLSRGRVRDLLEALEINGLEVRIKED